MSKVLQLTAVIEREGDGYVATCPEVDVVSQGKYHVRCVVEPGCPHSSGSDVHLAHGPLH